MGKLYKRLYKKMADGGYQNQDQYNNSVDSTGTSIAGGINPLFGALAKGGTATSKAVKGSESNTGKNIGGTAVDPFNQFKGNANGADWADSFGIPIVGAVKGTNTTGNMNRDMFLSASMPVVGSFVKKGMMAKDRKVEKDKEQFSQFTNQGVDNYNQVVANGYNIKGNEGVNYYKNGGKLYSKLANGGNLTPLSNENMEVKGRSHEEGGVKFPEAGVELEGGETINKDFVFSDKLGSPTYADRHKRIAKAMNSIEGKPKNNATKFSLNRLKEREEQLKVEQEQLKETLGIDDNGVKRYGGSLYKKMAGGGVANAGKVVSNVAPYADNIANLAINYSRRKDVIPQQAKTNYINPVEYNFAEQKNEANRQMIGFREGMDQGNVSTGVANTNKAVGLAQTIKAKNQIQEAENNANNQEKARVSTFNSGIQTNNNSIDLNNKMRILLAKDDRRREDSTNITNASAKYMQNSKDNKLEGLVRDQNNLNLSTQDPKTVSILMKSNRELFKRNGWTDAQIDDYINNSNSNIDMGGVKRGTIDNSIDFNKGKYGGSLRSKLLSGGRTINVLPSL